MHSTNSRRHPVVGRARGEREGEIVRVSVATREGERDQAREREYKRHAQRLVLHQQNTVEGRELVTCGNERSSIMAGASMLGTNCCGKWGS